MVGWHLEATTPLATTGRAVGKELRLSATLTGREVEPTRNRGTLPMALRGAARQTFAPPEGMASFTASRLVKSRLELGLYPARTDLHLDVPPLRLAEADHAQDRTSDMTQDNR